MSRGLRSRSSRVRIACAGAKHSSSFSGSSAGIDELYGSDMPSASIAEAMVLAVYMPPQAPAPGQLWRTIACRVRFVDLAGEVFAVALKGRDDVELLAVAGGPALIVPP